jgi:peptidoglycan/LPS O-acetylase OafA/YrhL
MLAACAVAVCFGVLWSVPTDSRLGSGLRWMGSRSFALYLVHEPIVVSAAIVGAGQINPLWSVSIAIPVALAITELFYRFVERPSTAFARSFSLPRLRWLGSGSS